MFDGKTNKNQRHFYTAWWWRARASVFTLALLLPCLCGQVFEESPQRLNIVGEARRAPSSVNAIHRNTYLHFLLIIGNQLISPWTDTLSNQRWLTVLDITQNTYNRILNTQNKHIFDTQNKHNPFQPKVQINILNKYSDNIIYFQISIDSTGDDFQHLGMITLNIIGAMKC